MPLCGNVEGGVPGRSGDGDLGSEGLAGITSATVGVLLIGVVEDDRQSVSGSCRWSSVLRKQAGFAVGWVVGVPTLFGRIGALVGLQTSGKLLGIPGFFGKSGASAIGSPTCNEQHGVEARSESPDRIA